MLWMRTQWTPLWRTIALESQLVSISLFFRMHWTFSCVPTPSEWRFNLEVACFSFVAPFKYQSFCKCNKTQRPPLQPRDTMSWCLSPFDKWVSGAGSLSAVCPLDCRPNAQQLAVNSSGLQKSCSCNSFVVNYCQSLMKNLSSQQFGQSSLLLGGLAEIFVRK